MPRNLLSAISLKSKLKAAQAEVAQSGKTVRIGDGEGLMLVVRPGGTAWVLRFMRGGSRTDLSLGKWPTVTLEQARISAEAARQGLHKGIDPVETRVAQRVKDRVDAEASSDTFRLMFAEWQGKQKHSKVYAGNIESAFTKDVFPAIGSTPPHLVTRKMVLEILRKIEERGAHDMVRRVRLWLKHVFDYGVEDESRPLLTESPVPYGTLKSFAKHDRTHFPALTKAEEVGPLMTKIRGIQNNWIIRNALMVSAYLWQRPTEIRHATWAEFDLKTGVWTIPAERMKMRQEHLVPLAKQVVALLRHHQGIVGTVGWLFPGRKYGEPISEGTLTSRLNSMGYLGKHSPHGFRATARTLLRERLKIDKDVIEKQLSHEHDTSGLGGAYDRAEYWDERVAMMQAWADWLDAQK